MCYTFQMGIPVKPSQTESNPVKPVHLHCGRRRSHYMASSRRSQSRWATDRTSRVLKIKVCIRAYQANSRQFKVIQGKIYFFENNPPCQRQDPIKLPVPQRFAPACRNSRQTQSNHLFPKVVTVALRPWCLAARDTLPVRPEVQREETALALSIPRPIACLPIRPIPV